MGNEIMEICRGASAGTRSGEYRNGKLPVGLLEKAYANTVDRLLGVVRIKE